ncbi:MAG: twin-arginine translocase TatA/TatE family subunit [Bacteroidales bacterium]|jgi:sec-independent protein translocase protein TatA|nr:twin-arginine translocase TatA/TatE family subunit [Bacteroidales bacterium]
MISGGEIFIILLAVLLLFGSNKLPDVARMMGKGVREFKKATDDIKREFDSNTSGVMNDFKAIRDDITGTLDKELAAPLQETASETVQLVEENFKDPYSHDDYYDNKEYNHTQANEYAEALVEDKPPTDAEETAPEEPTPEPTQS